MSDVQTFASHSAVPDLSKRLLKLAAPLVIGGLGVAMLHLGQTYIFGHHPKTSQLFALSVMQPFFFLFIAVMEAVAITNQVVAAKASQSGPHRRAVISSFALSILVATLVATIACLFLPLRSYIDFGDSIGGQTAQQILPYWFLSLLPFAIFEVINAGLRGIGRTKEAMVLMLILVVLNLLLVAYLVKIQGFGIAAIVWANWIIPTILAIPAAVLLYRSTWSNAEPQRPPLPIFLPIMLGAVGGPIFLSMISVFISSIVIFPFLTAMGPENTSAFLIIMRVRALLVIPAVALGTGLAILINQNSDRLIDEEKRTLLFNGLRLTIVFYLVFAVLGALLYDTVFTWMVADPAVVEVIKSIKGAVVVTFLTIPLLAMLQTMLEQLGRGVLVVLSTLIIELLTVGLLLLIQSKAMDMNTIMMVVLVNAAAYLAILFADMFLNHRKFGQFMRGAA